MLILFKHKIHTFAVFARLCPGEYLEYKHMTFYEAAELAKRADVAKLWLTHYSPSLIRAEEFMRDVNFGEAG